MHPASPEAAGGIYGNPWAFPRIIFNGGAKRIRNTPFRRPSVLQLGRSRPKLEKLWTKMCHFWTDLVRFGAKIDENGSKMAEKVPNCPLPLCDAAAVLRRVLGGIGIATESPRIIFNGGPKRIRNAPVRGSSVLAASHVW